MRCYLFWIQFEQMFDEVLSFFANYIPIRPHERVSILRESDQQKIEIKKHEKARRKKLSTKTSQTGPEDRRHDPEERKMEKKKNQAD
jgi:hypothetical protein